MLAKSESNNSERPARLVRRVLVQRFQHEALAPRLCGVRAASPTAEVLLLLFGFTIICIHVKEVIRTSIECVKSYQVGPYARLILLSGFIFPFLLPYFCLQSQTFYCILLRQCPQTELACMYHHHMVIQINHCNVLYFPTSIDLQMSIDQVLN